MNVELLINNLWLRSGLLVLSALVLAFVIRLLLVNILNWLLKKQKLLPIKYNVKSFFFPAFGLLVFLLSLLVLFEYFDVWEDFNQYLRTFFNLVLVFVCTWNISKIIDLFVAILIYHYDISSADNLSARRIRTQLQYLERIFDIFVWIVGLSSGLMTIESVRELGKGLLASAGIASVVVGFAAQRSLRNILAGFQIAFTQPLRIDDVVVVEGEWGRIEEINLTYVVVKIWDLRRLILPITYFTEKPFQNWTRTTADLLAYIYIFTDYSVPVDEIRRELTNILNSTELWDKKVNILQVTDFKEFTVEIRALFSASSSEKAWDLRCFVREKLINYLQREYPNSLPQIRLKAKKEDIDNN
ncbi:MAG: mechanosensitive ion channel [Bdellovibrionales bacterium]|nr:mechanosensitive ion channel [Bdellovibrionales bacterium]